MLRVLLEIDRDQVNPENSEILRHILEQHPGPFKVIIAVMDARRAFLTDVTDRLWVDGTDELMGKLKSFIGHERAHRIEAGLSEDA